MGGRSDLISLKRSIDEGVSQLGCWEEHFEPMTKYYKAMDRYRSLKVPPRTEKTKVIVIFGPTGSGKSFCAHKFPNTFTLAPPAEKKGSLWFDGYDGHTTLVVDEFYGWIRYDTMLRLCDEYAFHAPIKGSFVNFNSKYIVITSNKQPSEWYDYTKFAGNFAPLHRRIDLIIEKFDRSSYRVLKYPGQINQYDALDFESDDINFSQFFPDLEIQ
jgi:hypothetical protein